MIVSRIAVCLPRDESVDDIAVDGAGGHVPGGRWLVDPLVARFKEREVVITFFEADPAQYWWIDVAFRGVQFKLTVGHVFPYECVVSLLTRRGLIDRLLHVDHVKEAEELFSLVCDVIGADPRAGRVLTWKGSSRVRDEQRFLGDARRELEGTSPLPGAMRVNRKPRK